MKTIFLAAIVPSALPALRVTGALFLIVNLLAGAWAWRHRRQLFGPDSAVTGDRPAIRQLQAIVLGIPWLFLTFRLLFIWVELWIA
jgi:hypothetical protein